MDVRETQALAELSVEQQNSRERVLRGVLWSAVVAYGFTTPWYLLQEHPTPLMRVVFVGAALAVLCCAVRRTLPFFVRFGVLLLSLHMAALAAIALRGYTPNAFLAMGLMVVLVTLLVGRRAGFVAVAIVAASVLALSLLHHSGLILRDAEWRLTSDSANVQVMTRVTIIFTLISITCVVGISHVVDRTEELALQKILSLAALQQKQAENARLMADLVQREAALETLNHSLEQRVLERTSLLRDANESLAKEMEARLRIEFDLRQAQKLESLGRLAAGVAHEINTPLQFVSDSVAFVAEAHRDLSTLIARYRSAMPELADSSHAPALRAQLDALEQQMDLDYALENVPAALQRSLDGLRRVGSIVRSLKEFSHPGQQLTQIDLNHAIESTLTIAAHEYKGVAEVSTDFAELPPITCYAGEINQAVLNVVVNAAHAIAERKLKASDTEHESGHIWVRTQLDADHVVISIRDNGGGIPDAIRDRIFDPFFTTKPVGKGTGQGLAIAHAALHEKHAGSIRFETEVGRGTTFFMRLPIAPD
jgi:signal transduction histidine kinase